MNRAFFFWGLTTVLLSQAAVAQITFDESNLSGLVGHHVSSMIYQMGPQDYPSLSGILGATGGGKTYDFGSFSYTLSGIEYDLAASPDGTLGSGDPDFDGSNWVQGSNIGGSFFSYSRLDGTGLYLLGSVFQQATDVDHNGVLDQTVTKLVPPDRQYAFPLTDGTEWNQQYVSSTEGFGSTSQTTNTVSRVVQGWGTLVTPLGSAPALRLQQTLTVESTGFSYTTVTHLFVTSGGLGASIILQDGVIQSASYSSTTAGGATAVEEVPGESNQGFRLEPNFPNPFTSSTTISYLLDRTSDVKLQVFDLLGRSVADLVDARQAPGRHSAEFEAAELPAGLYMSRLEVDGSVTIRSLLKQ